MWRPLEEKDEEEVVDRSAALQKRKRKSPAAAARSRQRFLQRQEKRNTHRLQLESRNTPHQSIETSKTWTRLTKRLENKHILNICKGGGAESWALGCGATGKTAIKPNLLCSHSYYSPCDVITFWIKWFQMAGRMLQMSQQFVVTAMLVCLHWFCKLDHRCWDAETVWKCC